MRLTHTNFETSKPREITMSTSVMTLNKRRLAASASALMLLASATAPAYANIDNTATASGTYGGNTVTSPGDSESVPVVPKSAALTMDKTAGAITTSFGPSASIVDAGDTITYSYSITNTGNVTITNVTPVDTGPTFNGKAGTGTMGTFTQTSAGDTTLDPGEVATFTATYTMSALDVLHAADVANAVSNTATATGKDTQNATITSAGDTATATIPAGPALTVSKAAVLTDSGTADGLAAAGEVITYTYTITNTGNVPLTGVTVNDIHEGQALASSVFTSEALVTDGPLAGDAIPVNSSDATANDGIWTTLQPGAVITITYTHTVTQPEVDAQ